MTDQPTQEADPVPRPDAPALESSFDRTQRLLQEFREELARLMAKVHRDVEQLREATLSELGPLPGADRPDEEEARAERRIAEIVGEEQAMLRTRTMINEVIDERFRQLNELIHRAKDRQNVKPLQNQRASASRRKP